jgi:hypothetical protein
MLHRCAVPLNLLEVLLALQGNDPIEGVTLYSLDDVVAM